MTNKKVFKFFVVIFISQANAFNVDDTFLFTSHISLFLNVREILHNNTVYEGLLIPTLLNFFGISF